MGKRVGNGVTSSTGSVSVGGHVLFFSENVGKSVGCGVGDSSTSFGDGALHNGVYSGIELGASCSSTQHHY